MRKRLALVAGSSSEFWEVDQTGSGLTITFGRIGTAGQTQYRFFASPAAAASDEHLRRIGLGLLVTSREQARDGEHGMASVHGHPSGR